MTQKLKRNLRGTALFLVCVLFLAILPPQADAALADNTIRVGLFYGSKALPTANLANEIGSGYEFGFFDKNGAFYAVGSTAQEKITVCKDTNLYLSGGSFYETPTSAAYTLIGAYHLQIPGTYATYEEAASAAAGYPYGFPAYVDGEYVVRFEFYSSSANASADAASYAGAFVVGGSSSGYTVVNTATGAILFEYDCGSDSYLGIMPNSGNATLAQTWFKGYQYYGGFEYMRRSGNDLSVLNVIGEDLYVAGVLPYEFVSSGGLESLKAGAVAIRTFARVSHKHSASGFDICNTTDCQVYRGVFTGTNADKVLQAVEETSGECAYYNGALIEALYFSSDGGATEDAVNAWGGDHPYLKGKEDPYESTISFNGQSWSYQVTPAQLKDFLTGRGYSCATIVDFAVTETTSNGNVNEITITDSNGKTFVFKRDDVRLLQNLPGVTYMSRRFTITSNGGGAVSSGGTFDVYDGNTTITRDSVTAITSKGQITVTAPAEVLTGSGTSTVGGSTPSSAGNDSGWTLQGGGYGHNIGMSQWGAYAMAKLGYSYDEILKFYYTGITIR